MRTDVLFFLPNLAGGGAERVTLQLASSLAERGASVGVVLGDESGPLEIREGPRLRVFNLGVRRVLDTPLRLRRVIRRERPRSVVAVHPHTAVLLWLVWISLMARPKLVLVHHNTLSVSLRHSRRLKDRILPNLLAFAFGAADVRIAVSRGVADDLSEMTGISRDRISVVYNAIDFANIRRMSVQEVGAGVLPDADGSMFVAAGRLVPAKGFDILLEAFALAKPSHGLVILGEGPLLHQLTQQSRSLGIADRVSFPGFLVNPYSVFARADALVLSSRWEGLPTVLVEALCLQCGIVASDCRSGPREILRDGLFGTLVPVGDVRALAEAMDAAVPRDRPLQEVDLDPYSIMVVCERFESLLALNGDGRLG